MTLFSPPTEREVVIKFLREYTHLRQLADLLEAGVHWHTKAAIRAYCEKNGILTVEAAHGPR